MIYWWVLAWWVVGFASYLAGFFLFEDELMLRDVLWGLFVGLAGVIITVSIPCLLLPNLNTVLWRRK